jgi:hypothetical protein
MHVKEDERESGEREREISGGAEGRGGAVAKCN